MISHDSREPPGMREGPLRAPSSPPETPMPTKWIPVPSSSFPRRCVSVKREFPPSIMTSPFSSNGAICWITASTGAPAFTMIIALRGRVSAPTNSSIVRVGVIFLSLARPAANLSVTSVVRLKTATENPLESMFRTRFSPITARPMRPISH